MTEENIEKLYRISAEKVDDCKSSFKRYCFGDVIWSDRLIGLKGAWGVLKG